MEGQHTDQLMIILEDFVRYMNPNWKNDPDMIDTPERLSRMYRHFFRNEDPTRHFSKKFPTHNKQLVILKGIECFGMCPHHSLPVEYKINIGYIPNGWALGLSKFSRISKALSSYPKLQENFTTEIATLIYQNLAPKGVIVTVEGEHGCMSCRGIESNIKVVTSAYEGDAFIQKDQRDQFYRMLN